MRYRNSGKSLREIGEELGATHALSGSVYWDRDADTSVVRVNAELVRLSDGIDLWADSYERTLDRIFAIQNEIAEEVTQKLMVTVSVQNRYANVPQAILTPMTLPSR